MLLGVVLTVLCLPFLWWYFFLQKFKSLSAIPGPRPLPLIGNALDVGDTPTALFNNCAKLLDQYGDIFKVFIANECKVFIANADFLEEIMTSNVHITKSNGYYLLKPFLNFGLLTSSGSKWKRRRKLITPTFHFKILDQFLDIFNASSDILVKKLFNEVGKESTDVYPYIHLFSLDVICAMGVKISSQEGKNSEYVNSLIHYFDIFIVRFFSAWRRFDFLFKFAPEYPIQEKYLETLQRFSTSVIKKRRLEKSQEVVETTSDLGIKRRVALLDLLLESDDLTNDDIKEEINTFMFEGHDTTASGVTFALLALAENPEVQQKVYDEVLAVVGDETYVSMQHLQDTKYLEMVIKEVQRKYGAVPFVERQLEMDATIRGVHFPRGTTLNLYLYGVHHNEKYFPEPEKFDPDRFWPHRQSERHNYAFVPFSAGPRNCVGQKFAMHDMKVTIIKILQKFEILTVPGYKPELGMAAVLKSYNGMRLRFIERDNESEK
ncbi:cytochrome P450 4d2-like isoform X2 [Zophobas morio]|uniref:cytochrome P450 4d2-like isoform X2 n=1 Tax=Zophobas morio TaxID=2755281 RepID=UPI0030834FEB